MNLISLLSEEQQLTLFREVFYDNHLIRLIQVMPFVMKLSTDHDALKQRFSNKILKQAVDEDWEDFEESIAFLPETIRKRIVSRLARLDDVNKRFIVYTYLSDLSEEGRDQLVDRSLSDQNALMNIEAVKAIAYVSQDKQEQFFLKAFEHDPAIVHQYGYYFLSTLPEDRRLELEQRCGLSQELSAEQSRELTDLALSTPLYRVAPDAFFRTNFYKTGSRTTLLGAREIDKQTNPERSLKARVIVRHIPYFAYQIWRNAFENSDFWKQEGFDHVPIEPIIRVQSDKMAPSDVAVFSRVLGPSVHMWLANTSLFQKEIGEQMEHITASLKKMGISHGHLHDDNFCLAFYKQVDGSVDLSRPPLVYAIDFDQAKSIKDNI